MGKYLFTSEAVAIGHPDKVADQISDAILDACLEQDPRARVACETLVSTGLVVLAGEITTTADVDYQQITREKIRDIGYTDPKLGFDYRSCGILRAINKQSPDIAMGVNMGEGLNTAMGAGDQGMMFGFACNETPEGMPLPISFAQEVVRELHTLHITGVLPYLCPDGKAQITVEYNEPFQPLRIHTVVISTQHDEAVDHATIARDMRAMVKRIAPPGMVDEQTIFHVNPSGRFVLGGPVADCGLTGRKVVVDTYGGMARSGGGAFSGKDPTKVDRSAAYAGRYVAKNIVQAGLADRCEIQIAYALGVAEPISIKIDTFGTAHVDEETICRCIPEVFDLTPKGMIQMLDLQRPIYAKTAWGGHFGREEKEFTWEKTDKIDALKNCLSAAVENVL